MEARDTQDYYLECLTEELAGRCAKNSRYSLRAFARACGISPGVLSQFLSGKRVPSYKMAEKILGGLDLSPEQKDEFLGSLASKHQKRGLQRLNPVFKGMRHVPKPRELSLDLFRVIGDWYHYAVLMLTFVESFRSSPKWIAAQLDISELEAKLAIARLIEVGLMKDEDGVLVATEAHFTTADKHMTNAALKRHTRQSLEKAVHSLENDPIEVRSMNYMTMAIDVEKIPEAKVLIEEFTNRMSALLETGRRTQVYEFGMYLYPLQKLTKELSGETT
jgi:uncharacterized protein (TIGR02147 family)